MNYVLKSIVTVLFIGAVAHAQTENATLFKIDDQDYKAGLFLESIQKNNQLTSTTDETIEKQLERFINFHLKLTSAYNKQLDTLPAFKNEFASYYKQIADNYISNSEVTEAMVRETYERTQTEIRASHILLKLPKHEEDTIETYQKALEIKTKIEDGEDFEAVARQFSEDPSVVNNGGDLNWFNAFMMIYEFEDAAYNLKLNEISTPVRTDYGYHIIKKTGERSSKGKLKTAHIMLLARDSLNQPKESIHKIYNRIQDGEDFHELAKQYSQDTRTAEGGGYVAEFSLGGLNSKTYENKVYDLEKAGDVTEPFQTQFGWHIVKLIETIPLEPFEEIKDDLKNKLKQSNRSKLLVSKIKEELEKLYTVSINDRAITYFENALDSSYLKYKWKYNPREEDTSNFIIKVETQNVDFKKFGEHLQKKQRSYANLFDYKLIVNAAIDDLLYSELLSYHKKRLPEMDEEFASRINEFKDGLLIYDFMQRNVWEPVSKDSINQKKYYEQNKESYKLPEEIVGKLYSSPSKNDLKQVRKHLKINNEKVDLPESVIEEEVELEVNSPKIPKKINSKEGLSKIFKHKGQYVLADISKIKEAHIPDFENVRGKVMSDLQDHKEQELIARLRKEHEVFINTEVLNTIKAEFEN